MWWVSLSPRPLPSRRQRFQASPPTDRGPGQTICREGGELRSGRGAFGNLTPSRSTSNDLSWQLLRFIAQQGSVHLRKANFISFGYCLGCQWLPTLFSPFTI